MIIPSKFSGKYDICVFSPGGILRLQTDWFENIVTDVGLNRIGVGNFLTHCYVGSGTDAPSPTNTTLIAQVGNPSTSISGSSAGAAQAPPYYGSRSLTFTFGADTVVGNLSEVGVGWESALFSRARIQIGGVDGTVTVLPGETLTVTYTVINYCPDEDVEFQAIVDSVTRNCIMRTAGATSGNTSMGWGITGGAVSIYDISAYDGELGSVTSGPSGTVGVGDGGNITYLENSLEKGMTGNWGFNSANFANGIKTFLLRTNGLGSYQFSVDPPIAKTSENTLAMSFKVSWSRP